tara:strand:- start:78 stop:359 length:282 start_codon:yes stop_codon:yes gene_type:complete
MTTLSKADKKRNRKENWKCSGKKLSHGMRSSVAKTWDSSKGKVKQLKVLKPSAIPSDRLDAMSLRVSEATGWGYDWVRSMEPNVIMRFAKKHL